MNYHFKIHKEGKGYWAQCIELKGCITQANSLKELKTNMQSALNLYLEETEDSEDLVPLPDKSLKPKKNIANIPVDPQVAFAFLVRFYRIKHKMTQQGVAKKLGFQNIYSYKRLETKRCNPRLETISSLKQLFPELSIDFALHNNQPK